ncbi:MAG: glutamine-hydrolyzing GMP synthase [Candidatus Thermoplasmatota archaeon]|nr:glutamine-hydrolyzing GMP synthase [Candidatus Thermoplasmatota archaeon]
MTEEHDTICIVDNGGQFAHLIASRIRDHLKVKTVIMDPQTDANEILGALGIILSGGPDSIHEEGAVKLNPDIMEIEAPILGLCYGMHQIAVHYGGNVSRSDLKEYGYARLGSEDDPIFEGIPQNDRVWMSHGDKVTELPVGFSTIGRTDNCPISAMSDPARRRWGFQFHPEVEDTAHGMEMLGNFVLKICGARPTWRTGDIISEIVDRIKEEAGSRKVLTLVSGGVDSSVVAALLNRALPPEQLRFIHIDTGLMRHDESRMVEAALREQGLENLKVINSKEAYFDALDGLVDPEEKRKVIGRLFVEIVNREAVFARDSDWVLAQGTLYPDTIESGGTRNADIIKTHHNRVDLIMEMIDEGRVIEPVRELYKAEVRQVGELLGLPPEMVHRHPFPGPGLGIRALCQDESVIEADLKGIGSIQRDVEMAIRRDVWASERLSALVLPIRSVGVKGDARSYEHPVAMWCLSDFEWGDLKTFATRLVNGTRGINRCIIILHPETFRTPVPVPRYLTEKRVDLLREADRIVMEGLVNHDLYDRVWQCPTVLVPLSFGRGELIVIRPVWSSRAMTAEVAELPDEFYTDVMHGLLSLTGIESVAVDVTSKPPGTIEWE